MGKLTRAVVLAAVALLPFVAVADNPIAFRIGPGAQMTCSASAPTHISTRGMVWCNSADLNKLYYTDPAGASSAIGVVQPAQLMTASFSSTDTATLSWTNEGGTQYVFVGAPVVTDGLGGVTFWITSKTSTGATLNASAPWTGTVAVSVVSE